MVHVTERADRVEEEPVDGIFAAQLGHGKKLHAQSVRIEPGAAADTHSHPHEQITYITAGSPIMTIDGEDHHFDAGDAVVIPGDVPHSARNESDASAELLDVFSPPREDLLD